MSDTPKNRAAFVTIPDDLPGTAEALDELEKEVRARYAEVRAEAGNAPTAEQVDEMEALAEALDAINQKRADLDEEEQGAEERTARAAAIAERFAAEPEAADDQPQAPEVGGEPAVPQDKADEAGGDDGTDDDGEGEPDPADDDQGNDDDAQGDGDHDKEFSMTKTKFGGAARGEVTGGTPQPKHIFALDRAVPDYTPGPVSLLRTAEAFEEIASGRALVASGEGRSVSAQFAHIKRDLPDDMIVHDERSAGDVLDHAVDETRLQGKSLVAAAGW